MNRTRVGGGVAVFFFCAQIGYIAGWNRGETHSYVLGKIATHDTHVSPSATAVVCLCYAPLHCLLVACSFPPPPEQ